MPTTVIKSIGTAVGRDYATMTLWIAACPANLVTSDQIWKGECYKDSTFLENVNITGITTDATRYVWLIPASGQAHTGIAGTGVKLNLNASTSNAVRMSCNYTKVEYIEIYNSAGTGWVKQVYINSSYCTLNGCILRDPASLSGATYTIDIASVTGFVITNNIIYGNFTGITQFPGYQTGLFVNNIVYNKKPSADAGGIAWPGSAQATIKNNYVYCAFGSCFSSTWPGGTGSADYNSSSDATADDAGGTNCQINKGNADTLFVSTTTGSEDFHLQAGSCLIATGQDLSASFTLDAEQLTRSAPWTIGAFHKSNANWFLLQMKNEMAYPNNL